ncbi:hypothetical protein ACQ1R4_11050, partial [Ornithobacterium rhinotracheale]
YSCSKSSQDFLSREKKKKENTNTIQNPKELLIYINSYKSVLLSTKKPYCSIREYYSKAKT